MTRDYMGKAEFDEEARAAQSDTPGEEMERSAFEAWAATEWQNSYPPHAAWTGWQARASLTASDTAGPSDHAGLVERNAELEASWREVWEWLVKRGLVDRNDDEWDGFVAVIERHEAEIEREAIAALSRATEAVAVKPLEWSDTHSTIEARALTPFGGYFITPKTGFHYAVEGPAGFRENHKRLSEAKAAAQADYERRILSALAAPPAPQPALALIEDIRNAVKWYADGGNDRGRLALSTLKAIDDALASAKRFKEGA